MDLYVHLIKHGERDIIVTTKVTLSVENPTISDLVTAIHQKMETVNVENKRILIRMETRPILSPSFTIA